MADYHTPVEVVEYRDVWPARFDAASRPDW
jgi:hypothetical protein